MNALHKQKSLVERSRYLAGILDAARQRSESGLFSWQNDRLVHNLRWKDDPSSLVPRFPLSPAFRGALFYLLFYATLAVYLPFLNVYFRQVGLSGWEIGLLSALFPIMTFLVATPVAMFADRRQRHLPLLALSCAGMTVSLVLFLVSSDFWALLPIMALLALCFSPLTALMDSTIAGMATRHDLNFGGMRLWGSLGFAVMSIVCGGLWQAVGYRPMFVVSAGLYLAVAGCALTLEGGRTAERRERVPLRMVRHDAVLIVLLVATFMVASAIGMDMTFAGIYMTHLGGTGLFVGLLFGISALCELPTMRYRDRIAGRLGNAATLLLAYALFAIAYLGYALSPTAAWMLGFCTVRGLAYGLFYVSTVRVLSERAPKAWSTTLQGIMNSLAFGLAQLISRPLSGRIYDGVGPSAVYVASAIAAGGAILLMGGSIARRLVPRERETAATETESLVG